METIASREVGPFSASIEQRSATVIDVQIMSETRVSGTSSGGGGMIFQGTGHVAAPTMSVRGRSEINVRAFMKLEDGKETTLDFSRDFPVRVGQTLLLRSLTFNGASYLVAVVNVEHSRAVGRFDPTMLEDPDPKTVNLFPRKVLISAPFVGFGASALTGMLTSSSGLVLNLTWALVAGAWILVPALVLGAMPTTKQDERQIALKQLMSQLREIALNPAPSPK